MVDVVNGVSMVLLWVLVVRVVVMCTIFLTELVRIHLARDLRRNACQEVLTNVCQKVMTK